MESNGRFYWLKLKRDFFKRHDIRIIEEMPNGKDYILFYLKLLCESVDHEGKLRFSESIPYSDVMLSTITYTNIDIVRSAIKAFTSLGMMEILDDGTIFMTEVNRLIGSAVDNDNANRQRRYRENLNLKTKELPGKYYEVEPLPQNVTSPLQKITEDVTKCNASVTKNNANVTDTVTKNNESKSIDIEKDIDKESDIDISVRPEDANKPKQKRFVKPTLEEVAAYCKERNNKVSPERFISYYESVDWAVGKGKMKDWKAAVRYWETNEEKAKSFSRRGSYFVESSEPYMDYSTYEAKAKMPEENDLDDEDIDLMNLLHGKKDA